MSRATSGEELGLNQGSRPTRACKVKNAVDQNQDQKQDHDPHPQIQATTFNSRKRKVQVVRTSDRLRIKQRREELDRKAKATAIKVQPQGVENRNISIEYANNANPYHKELFLNRLGLLPTCGPQILQYQRVHFIPESLNANYKRSSNVVQRRIGHRPNLAHPRPNHSRQNPAVVEVDLTGCSDDEEDKNNGEAALDLELVNNSSRALPDTSIYKVGVKMVTDTPRKRPGNVVFPVPRVVSSNPRANPFSIPSKVIKYSSTQQHFHKNNNNNDIPFKATQRPDVGIGFPRALPLPNKNFIPPQNPPLNEALLTKFKIDPALRSPSSPRTAHYVGSSNSSQGSIQNLNQQRRLFVDKLPQHTNKNSGGNLGAPDSSFKGQNPGQAFRSSSITSTRDLLQKFQSVSIRQAKSRFSNPSPAQTVPGSKVSMGMSPVFYNHGAPRPRLLPPVIPVVPARSLKTMCVPVPLVPSLPQRANNKAVEVQLIDLASDDEDQEKDNSMNLETIRHRLLAIDTDLSFID